MVWALSLKKLTDDECQQIITAFEVPLYEKKEVQSNVPIVHDPVSNLMFIDSCAIKYIHDQGKRLHNEGNYSEAIKCYDRALSINCRDYTILSDKGLSLHNEGNYSEAIKCYDRALSINCQDEFIKRRRNNTMTLLQKQINNIYSPQDKSKRYNSLNSKSKLSNTHLICIMVVVSALSLGIIFYSMSWADNNENSNSLIADQNLDSDGSVLKTNTDSTWITTKNKLDQGLIGEFTESVENQITIAAPSDKGFSGNNSINKGPDIQHSNDIRPSELGTDKVGEIAQRVDNFKLELEKAMESNFN
jgi:tetratricopeptide (TPR) repeat protein